MWVVKSLDLGLVYVMNVGQYPLLKTGPFLIKLSEYRTQSPLPIGENRQLFNIFEVYEKTPPGQTDPQRSKPPSF